VYELKAMGMLSAIVAELLSPRRSGHGVREEAEKYIAQQSLDSKLANCIDTALRLAEAVGQEPAAVAAVLVTGFEGKKQILEQLRETIKNSYGGVSDTLMRTAVTAAEQFLRSLITTLSRRLRSRGQAPGGSIEVMVRRNRASWEEVCSELMRRKRSASAA